MVADASGFPSTLTLLEGLVVLVYGALMYVAYTNPSGLENLVYKAFLAQNNSKIFVFSKDKSWKSPGDAAALRDVSPQPKRIVFIRHGESEWNEVFNKGFGPSFIKRLFLAVYREIRMLVTRDSVFIDSSLNREGVRQAKDLHKFLSTKGGSQAEILQLIAGEKDIELKSSVVACSNLRRAIETCTIGLQHRFKSHPDEKVFILSTLQEVSRNVDANALAPANSVPDLHALKKEVWSEWDENSLYDVAHNTGNKPLNSNGLKRMLGFCDWAFQRPENTVIAVGHSLYFRFFFKTFLPQGQSHVARDKKMANCAVVSFNLYQGKLADGKPFYRIDPKSIEEVYIGFEVKKGK